MLRVGRVGIRSVAIVGRRWGTSASVAAASSSSSSEEYSPEVLGSTDPWAISYYMRAEILLDEVLKIPKAEQADFKKNWEISLGNWTLEWCHPSPMPFHTYDELPIIKTNHD